MIQLRAVTKDAWAAAVLADFDAFIVDHAACERKAMATGMAFVVRYPDRRHLIGPCIAFAREELEHFEEVYEMVAARGLQLVPDKKDAYVGGLIAEMRDGRDTRLLDRLLVAGIVEARGCERFGIIANAVEDASLKEFYSHYMRAEARHQDLFVRLARHYFDDATIEDRLSQLLDVEAAVVERLPIIAALH